MKNKSVAILDIRSNEIAFLLGSEGVNGTFVFNGMHIEKYEGYKIDGFFETESFYHAVTRAIASVQQNYQGRIEQIFVGVPSPFVSVITKGHAISFHSKRKISETDVEALFESGLNELLKQGRCIRYGAMYFTLGDNRKYFSANDLYGVPTTMLKGALCYYFVSESFYENVVGLLAKMGFADVKFIPSTLAQSIYLLSNTKRENYAFLLDVGFMVSSISIVYGNGIVHEENFDCGFASILVALMKDLNVEYAVAEELLSLANVSGGLVPPDFKYRVGEQKTAYSAIAVNEIIKGELDRLAIYVEEFLRKDYKEKTLMMMSVNPISVTGEGIHYIKGAVEYIANELNWVAEVVHPDLPYYDKPTWSSRIALLSMAVSDREKQSWIRRIFNIGGKKK